MSTLEQIKKVREMTGAGIVDTKKALDEAGGDEAKAIEILREKGQLKAAKKSDREAHEGMVFVYAHSNGKVGSIVKLHCESDFVARNTEFQELGRDIAMHIAAMSPEVLRAEDISEEKEGQSKEERALLTQAFIKNPEQTIAELVSEKIAKIGENIQVGEFSRLEI